MKSKVCCKRNGEPRAVYYSECEALDGAEYANATYQQDLIPYKCDKCRSWHLTPKSRQTPTLSYCGCTGQNQDLKHRYDSEESARQRARISKQEKNISLNVYACPRGKGWHLTSR